MWLYEVKGGHNPGRGNGREVSVAKVELAMGGWREIVSERKRGQNTCRAYGPCRIGILLWVRWAAILGVT